MKKKELYVVKLINKENDKICAIINYVSFINYESEKNFAYLFDKNGQYLGLVDLSLTYVKIEGGAIIW